MDKEKLVEILSRYFDIGDSYTYELTRVKEAFWVGTMTLEDFEEWTEENIDDLAEYIIREMNGVKPEKTENCLTCSKSWSADDENGVPCLICRKNGKEVVVREDGHCDEYS